MIGPIDPPEVDTPPGRSPPGPHRGHRGRRRAGGVGGAAGHPQEHRPAGAKSQIVGKAVPAVAGTTLDGTALRRRPAPGPVGGGQLLRLVVRALPGRAARAGQVRRGARDDPDVAMVGVMYQDKEADAAVFYQRSGATWPILDDDGTDRPQLRRDRRARDLRGQPGRPGGGQVRGRHHRRRPRPRDPALRRRVDTTAPSTTHGRRHAVSPLRAPLGPVGGHGRHRGRPPWPSASAASSAPQTNAERMLAIASTLKCPVCSGESVAESERRTSPSRSASTSPSGWTRARAPIRSAPPTSPATAPTCPAHPGLDRRDQPGVDHPGGGPGHLGRRAGHGVPAVAVRGDVHATEADRRLVAAALDGLAARSPRLAPTASTTRRGERR